MRKNFLILRYSVTASATSSQGDADACRPCNGRRPGPIAAGDISRRAGAPSASGAPCHHRLAGVVPLVVLTKADLCAEAEVRAVSERFGLAVDPSARVEDLPVGVQQRVEISRLDVSGSDIGRTETCSIAVTSAGCHRGHAGSTRGLPQTS